MKYINLAAALLLFVLPCSGVWSQPDTGSLPASPTEPTIEVPDTPAGRQLAWFLGTLSGNGLEEIATHFSDQFKAQVDPGLIGKQLQVVGKTILADGRAEVIALDPASTEHRVAGRIRSSANGVVMSFVIQVDPATGLIDGLSSQVIPGAAPDAAKSWEELDAKLAKLPGTLTVFAAEVTADGAFAPVHTLNPDARLGIGSTFKLYVLGALAEMVRDGGATWDQELAIRDDWKSLPSGTMQTEEPGTTHPLSEFALKMISISDNTATDHLIELVGRERIEAYMARINGDPARSIPFLNTRDLFALKLSDDRTLADRYIASDASARRAMLAPEGDVGKASPSMMAAAMWRKPLWIENIEWFATGEECARAIVEADRLATLEANAPAGVAMRTNPGIGFDRKVWTRIAFKGGSEVGVMNLTWLLDRADGKRFAISFGWNNPEAQVDEQDAVTLAGEAVALLERVP